MVKPPRIKHSKTRKGPVTIDLDASEVKREAGETTPAAAADSLREAQDGLESEPVKPNAADEALADEQSQRPPDADAPVDDAATESISAGESRYGPAASETPSPPRSHTIPAIAAGVTGAVVALLGAAALQWSGVLPSPPTDRAPLEALRGEFETLRQEVAAGYGAAADPALAQAVAESSERIEGLAASVEQLRADFSALQSQAGAEDPAPLQALEARIAEIETSGGAAGADDAALEQISRQLAELGENVNAAAEAAGAQAARLDALEQRVEAQAAEPGMAMAVAATALKSAIDRGTPFMMELETYAAIAPDTPQIAALRDLAASGVPTRAEIEAEIPDAAARMVAAAAAPADENAGFLERMFTSAQSLVEVRPVGSVEGDSPGAIVARMEVALREGDHAQAIEEYRTLPPAAQAAGEEFMAKVEARQTADRLIAEALAGALSTPEDEG